MFLRCIITLFAVLILCFQQVAYATRWNTKIGTPIYVLQQPARAHPENTATLWELRPSETRDQLLYEGSRLLATFRQANIQSFAIAGFEMDDASIRPNLLLVLSGDGTLASLRLPDGLSTNAAKPRLETLPGRYALLEQTASESVLAVKANQEIVRITKDGGIQPHKTPPLGNAESIELLRETDGDILLKTNLGRVLRVGFYNQVWHAGDFVIDIHADDTDPSVVWSVDKNGKVRRLSSRGEMVSTELGDQLDDRQDGKKLEILGVFHGALLLRTGGHFTEVYFENGKLSRRVLALDFFADGLRTFGLSYSLGNTFKTLQPQNADRSRNRRGDLEYRGGPRLQKRWPRHAPQNISRKDDGVYTLLYNGPVEALRVFFDETPEQLLVIQKLTEILSRGGKWTPVDLGPPGTGKAELIKKIKQSCRQIVLPDLFDGAPTPENQK